MGPTSATSAAKTFLVTAEDIAAEGLSLETMQAELQKSPARQTIMFINACRNEPGQHWHRSFIRLDITSV